ncbi:MAG TPA: methionyl-tRNA formyltransferase [candidate division Zixibacteria bacterium]|nr:methionyl-tRNA formyltransferase [candidate division Zixibacteria bacterium]
MKLVFMGTADFAVPALEALAGAGHEIISVYTQPDRPSGRGLRLDESAVKKAARRLGLNVLQPASLKPDAEAARIRDLVPELAVVVAYGLKLPPSFLSAPGHGCLNLHPSLLPRYRGAAPINWALIRGEIRTGVTVIRMNHRMDAGEILLQQEAKILPEDDAGSLEARLAGLGAGLMAGCLDSVAAGNAAAVSQDEALATMAPKLGPDDCRVDWSRTGREIVNLIRGLTPKPGAYAHFRGKRLGIAGAEEVANEKCNPPAVLGTRMQNDRAGRIILVDKELGPVVGTGDGALALAKVKPEGKRLMSGSEFARGYRPGAGESLERAGE